MHYFFSGFSLIQHKGLKRFVLIPLLINLSLFSGAVIYLYQQLDEINQWANTLLPSWLSWLTALAVPLLILGAIFTFTFVFTTLANLISAPFNGILAEKVEMLLTGQPITNNNSIAAEIQHALQREWQKMAYYLPRALGFFIVFWLLPVGGQILWFLFGAWMMAIQYCDYPFDNHKISFAEMRTRLWQRKSTTFSFGAIVAICSMIPILNFIVIPVAVCGATKMWVKEFKQSA